jgi:hypothetical protein
MPEATKRRTGKILPRNYAILLSMPSGHEDLLVSPFTYMLAQLALETPGEIRTRLKDWARRNNVSLDTAVNELREGVEKLEGTKNLLNFTRRTETRDCDLALRRMKHYGNTFTAEVKSRTKEDYRAVSLPEPRFRRDITIGYPGASCECPDHIYGDSKKARASQVCMHIAIPEVALALDERLRLAQAENMTGLSPKERRMRGPLPELPFRINTLKDPQRMTEEEKSVWADTTDCLMRYFVERHAQYDINRDVLENPFMFGPALNQVIRDNRDRAEFKVIRQKEEEIARSKLSSVQDRRYAATTALLDNISRFLIEKWGYVPAGYCREFVGTPQETVARRFEPWGKGPVYSIVVGEEHPPLIVSRRLGEKASNIYHSNNILQRDTLAENIGMPYFTTDDVTRRVSTVEIKLPDKQLIQAGFHVPENLQAEYNALRSKIRTLPE